MSVTGISSNNLFEPSISQGTQNKLQQIQTEFQQLGQDLSSGNLTQAQQDFASLAQNLPGRQQTSSSNSNNPLAQAFTTLGNDLQSGNLAGAQQAFATIQQDVQAQQSSSHLHHHHHSGGEQNANATSPAQNNSILQPFSQLGQALQSGSLSSAQQSYAALQQDLQEYLPSLASGSSGGSLSSGGTTNVIA